MPQQNTTYTFNDMFKKGFLESFDTNNSLSWSKVIFVLALAFLMGAFIFMVYKKCFSGVLYSRSFNISLIMLSMITALIIMTVSANVLLSLGMVGALSIVRFRTAIKEPLDTVYMFWAIGAGITIGAGFFLVGIIGCVIIGILMFLLSSFKFKISAPYLLVLHYDDSCTQQVNAVLRQLPKGVLKNKTISKRGIEMTIELRLREGESKAINQFMNIPGVHEASLISYQGDMIS